MDLRAFTALFSKDMAKAAKAEAGRVAKAEKAAKAAAEKARKAAEKAAKADAARTDKASKAAEKAAKAEAARAEKARIATEKAAQRSTAKKTPKLDVQQFIREAGDLYDRGNDPSVTIDKVDYLMLRMESLTTNDLKRVADRIEMIVVAKSKGEILKKIRERIANRIATRVSVDMMESR
jgi:hypothetical protein